MTRRGTVAILFLAAAMAVSAAAAASSRAASGVLASRASCPGQGNANAPSAAQEKTMLCLVNHAREARGLAPLQALRSLIQAADRKSGDVIRCDEFSHEACGREFTLEGTSGAHVWTEEFGSHYC